MRRFASALARRFPQGTTRGAVARIIAALGVLLVVLVVLGTLQANGLTVSWGMFGTLAVAVIAFCSIVWVERRDPDPTTGPIRELDVMLDLLEAERVTPVDERTSGVDNPSLFVVRDLVRQAHKDLSHGFYPRAAEYLERVPETARRDQWSDTSPLSRQAERLGELARDQFGRRTGRRRLWRGRT